MRNTRLVEKTRHFSRCTVFGIVCLKKSISSIYFLGCKQQDYLSKKLTSLRSLAMSGFSFLVSFSVIVFDRIVLMVVLMIVFIGDLDVQAKFSSKESFESFLIWEYILYVETKYSKEFNVAYWPVHLQNFRYSILFW